MAIPSLSFDVSDLYRSRCFFVYGMVKDAQTDLPVANAHIYAVAGEEEGFSQQEGRFSLRTWGCLPLNIYIAHPGYQSLVSIIYDENVELRVLLEPMV